ALARHRKSIAPARAAGVPASRCREGAGDRAVRPAERGELATASLREPERELVGRARIAAARAVGGAADRRFADRAVGRTLGVGGARAADDVVAPARARIPALALPARAGAVAPAACRAGGQRLGIHRAVTRLA